MCKLKVESEKIGKKTFKQYRHCQKDNEALAGFFGAGVLVHSWSMKKL